MKELKEKRRERAAYILLFGWHQLKNKASCKEISWREKNVRKEGSCMDNIESVHGVLRETDKDANR